MGSLPGVAAARVVGGTVPDTGSDGLLLGFLDLDGLGGVGGGDLSGGGVAGGAGGGGDLPGRAGHGDRGGFTNWLLRALVLGRH